MVKWPWFNPWVTVCSWRLSVLKDGRLQPGHFVQVQGCSIQKIARHLTDSSAQHFLKISSEPTHSCSSIGLDTCAPENIGAIVLKSSEQLNDICYVTNQLGPIADVFIDWYFAVDFSLAHLNDRSGSMPSAGQKSVSQCGEWFKSGQFYAVCARHGIQPWNHEVKVLFLQMSSNGASLSTWCSFQLSGSRIFKIFAYICELHRNATAQGLSSFRPCFYILEPQCSYKLSHAMFETRILILEKVAPIHRPLATSNSVTSAMHLSFSGCNVQAWQGDHENQWCNETMKSVVTVVH